jgi:uncharacterized surface protein with fasciclin (FAS1) repeats
MWLHAPLTHRLFKLPLTVFFTMNIKATSILSKLNDPSMPWTILAPTNQAFGDLLRRLDMTERELFEDVELLSKVLENHIIPDVALKLDDLHDGQTVATLLPGQDVTFYRE